MRRRQHDRLCLRAVVVRPEVDRRLLDLGEHLVADAREPALGVPHRRGAVAVERPEVARAVDQRVAERKGLRHADERLVERGVAVGMEVAHHVADHGGALAVLAVGRQVLLPHRVEDAPLHRLEAVAHVGQRARRDHRQRVIQVSRLRRFVQRDVLGRAASAALNPGGPQPRPARPSFGSGSIESNSPRSSFVLRFAKPRGLSRKFASIVPMLPARAAHGAGSAFTCGRRSAMLAAMTRVHRLLVVGGAAAVLAGTTFAAAGPGRAGADDRRALPLARRCGHTWIQHPDPAKLKEAVRIYETKAESAGIPGRDRRPHDPAGSDDQALEGGVSEYQRLEYFALAVTPQGTTVRGRGDEASNRLGTCKSCHSGATKSDDICGGGPGCTAVPLTEEQIATLQKNDPRCAK